MVNSFDPGVLDTLPPAQREMIGKRQRLLGPAYRLFYGHPVEVSRASGVHMYDPEGNDYLDAYNNVVSVGHCHPAVVAATTAQLNTLCTHTRYLHPGILEFAEELLSTFEPAIEHVMFTCTGSEANDLALRIAKHHTGHQGIIITSEAYHGNSDLTSGLSPSLGEYSPLGTWVRRVPAPDSYRLAPEQLGRWFADRVQEQIDDLRRRRQGVAAFIADSLFSSDGVYSHPVDLLAPVAQVVRAAGGLFIADEVQSGFGRSGDRFWGYQRHGLVPDLVTMGKPMGNGFPVAAVAMNPAVIQQFGQDTRYFNTFGGNTVAIAAAQATLRVIKEEGLQKNAQVVGEAIRDGLRALAQKFEGIGDVRGAGMYIGVEMVTDRERKTPDPAAALATVNGLRARRVLISATGPDANVLKIRPPLVFSLADTDRLLTELENVLRN
ncbi:aspartate aminotransferase family protein [Caenimonas sp. S4]|nr:aspartate aminotransferase family protein [Caenimonas soli]